MSTEVMAWMRIKPIDHNMDRIKGFKALAELLKHTSLDITDPKTGTTLAYIEEMNNEELFSNLSELTKNNALTLMGYGDSWSFEQAQTLVDLLIQYKESVIATMSYNEEDRTMLEHLFDTIEKSKVKVTFSNVIYREEDMDVMEGFEEFVWCSFPGCHVPADYNFKRTENGTRKGYDDFPASRSLGEKDIPYCKEHFYEMAQKDL